MSNETTAWLFSETETSEFYLHAAPKQPATVGIYEKGSDETLIVSLKDAYQMLHDQQLNALAERLSKILLNAANG